MPKTLNRSAKGRRAEYRARDLLKEEGYSVMRSAGSKGIWDLIAWNRDSIRFIQVKSLEEGSVPKKIWMKTLKAAIVPHSVYNDLWNEEVRIVKELWIFVSGTKKPIIEKI